MCLWETNCHVKPHILISCCDDTFCEPFSTLVVVYSGRGNHEDSITSGGINLSTCEAKRDQSLVCRTCRSPTASYSWVRWCCPSRRISDDSTAGALILSERAASIKINKSYTIIKSFVLQIRLDWYLWGYEDIMPVCANAMQGARWKCTRRLQRASSTLKQETNHRTMHRNIFANDCIHATRIQHSSGVGLQDLPLATTSYSWVRWCCPHVEYPMIQRLAAHVY